MYCLTRWSKLEPFLEITLIIQQRYASSQYFQVGRKVDAICKVSLARAARTDAGVHAAGNVVSLKMIITIPGVSDIVARVNEELPPEIRLWGYVRAQNSFNARL